MYVTPAALATSVASASLYNKMDRLFLFAADAIIWIKQMHQ